MTLRNIGKSVLMVGLLAFSTATFASDDSGQGKTDDVKRSRSTATIERIMDQAVRNIGRRYNLNAGQLARTDELMRREVRRFLHEHENEVWPAIRDILTSPGGNPSDPETAKRIAKVGGPLVKLAKKAILDANAEWRLILTPQQKKTHDFDLGEMEKQFDQIEENFSQWADGKVTDGGVFPKSDPEDLRIRSPLRPTKPPGIKVPPAEKRMFDIDFFDTIVAKFIKDYGLDEGQRDSARSILKEFKGKAESFMNANRDEFAKILTVQERALHDRDLAMSRKADAIRKQLLEPVYSLVTSMERRLQRLPTSAQRARYEAKQLAMGSSGKTPVAGAAAKGKTPASTKEKVAKEKRGAAPVTKGKKSKSNGSANTEDQ